MSRSENTLRTHLTFNIYECQPSQLEPIARDTLEKKQKLSLMQAISSIVVNQITSTLVEQSSSAVSNGSFPKHW